MNYSRIEDDLSTDAADVLGIVKSDKHLDDKLKHFKAFLHKIKQENNDDLNLKDLLSIYFLLESKHPAKSLIQTFLNQNTDKKCTAIKIFTEILENQISNIENDEHILINGYKLVSYLNELSQNFEVAICAVGKSCPSILKFLNLLIGLFIKQLIIELSPSRKNETSYRLHNCFQVYIFCVRSRQKDESLESDFCSFIEELNGVCVDIFQNNNISMETKNIFAMLTVIRNIEIDEHSHMQLIANDNENIQKRLCLMSGVIQTVSHQSICNLEQFCIMLEAIFMNKSADNATVYTISRILLQIIKKMSSYKCFGTPEDTNTITKVAISISFLNLEHNVESVRYMSKETIRTLVEIGTKTPDGERHVAEILIQIFMLPIELKALAVSGIHQVLPVRKVLENIPDLLEMLLSTITSNKENKISCYLALSNKGCIELSFNDWYDIFIKRITNKLCKSSEPQEESFLLYNLLLKCIKKDKKAIQTILENRSNFNIRFYLMVLNLAKEEGILEATCEDKSFWKGVISHDEIKSAMVNADMDVRLSAVNLIVDTKKVTDEFNSEEIECIFYFFERNINLQMSHTKQTLVGIVKKFFARVRSNVLCTVRKNDIGAVEKLFGTLIRFHEFALSNLGSATNFSRRSLSLVILINIHEIIQQHFPQELENLWTEHHFNSLYNMLYDPYESNKERALELMSFVPRKIITNLSKLTFDHLEQLHKSIRPADSITACYLMLFCLKFPVINFNSLSSVEPISYKLLIWCENQLNEALRKAENSIIVAAGSNPMYAFISSIRSILSKVNLNDVVIYKHWKDFFDRLLHTTRRLTKIASPIVNDPSPEGIYPKENIHLLLNDNNEEDVMKVIQNTTSQMILLCAWRIIKEVSLLLGDLSLKAAVMCESSEELFTVNQLVDIGDDFLELLTNIKHRGAFEQCFSGFSQYCIALRTSHSFELHNLPSRILQNIMDSISQKSNILENSDLTRMKNLCATRRSAGLPFIIQALLSSEIKISKHENFHCTMKSLLRSAQSGEELEIRIHSLNILRVLYRCKELNDVINEYICEGIKCSILGCGSQTWAETNSSTLLFSSLMIRVFGVQRNKDTEQIDIKNKMSSKIFFIRYPELYDFFMEQLDQSANHVMQQRRNSKLYPLILILGRLFTSPSETCESNLKLVNFIPIITTCSGCIDLKTRVLCAKFVANVNPSHAVFPRVSYNLQILSDFKNLTTNFKHGRLLEVLFLIRNISKAHNNLDMLKRTLNDSFDLLKQFKSEIVCFSTLLDIIIQLLQILWHQNLRSSFTHEKLKMCFEFDKSAYFGIPEMHSRIIAIQLVQMEIEQQAPICLTIDSSLSFQELLQKLNSVILILSSSVDRNDIAEEYEIDEGIKFFIDNLSTETLVKLRFYITANDSFIKAIRMLTIHGDHIIQARSYEILSFMDAVGERKKEEINVLLDGALTKPDDYKIAILKYTKTWLEKNEKLVNSMDWEILANLMNSSYCVKLAIIDVLKLISRNLFSLSLPTMLRYSILLITLLMDDDFDIANEASKVVSHIINTDQVYITSHAIDIFIRHLLKSCYFKGHETAMFLVSLFIFQQKSSAANQDEEANEFQIFDKSETNNLKEWFVFEDILMIIWKNELDCKLSFDNYDIINFCKEIGIETNCKELLKVFEKLN